MKQNIDNYIRTKHHTKIHPSNLLRKWYNISTKYIEYIRHTKPSTKTSYNMWKWISNSIAPKQRARYIHNVYEATQYTQFPQAHILVNFYFTCHVSSLLFYILIYYINYSLEMNVVILRRC